ncbi:restriction endonuclease, partial [Methylomonas sp. 11b]|uniref:restriction endonuclease n=1 Tax=Methylomonas sp. 11b TaxID=1168169 RepID=UPI00047E1717
WIEEKGDLFRYELPLLIHYIYDNSLFTDSILYTRKIDPYGEEKDVNYALNNHRDVYDICEVIYLKTRVNRFQHTLESFNPNQYITIYSIDGMDGYQFEEFLVDLFRKRGCEVKSTPKGRDQGADLFIESFGSKIVIQAKNYQGNIGNKAVQEVIAAKQFYSYNDGIVITNRYFTPSAKELALSAKIKLIDRDELIRYLDEYNTTIIENNLETPLN